MNIFVGNLSFSVSEDQLLDIFSEFGEVKSAKIVTDRYTNRPRGFAFVEMQNKEDGMDAIRQLEGTVLESRTMVVNEAKPREERRSSFERRY